MQPISAKYGNFSEEAELTNYYRQGKVTMCYKKNYLLAHLERNAMGYKVFAIALKLQISTTTIG